MTTIYHNPACPVSRRVLAMLRSRGIKPAIVNYLQQPPDEDALAGLLRAVGISPRMAIRTHEPIYRRLGLDDRTLSEETLVHLMHIYPILIERPIVETPMGVRICQPPERLLEILPGDRSDQAHRKLKTPPA